jgi:hypothetical protein
VKFAKVEAKSTHDPGANFVMGFALRQELKLTTDTAPFRAGKKQAIFCYSAKNAIKVKLQRCLPEKDVCLINTSEFQALKSELLAGYGMEIEKASEDSTSNSRKSKLKCRLHRAGIDADPGCGYSRQSLATGDYR